MKTISLFTAALMPGLSHAQVARTIEEQADTSVSQLSALVAEALKENRNIRAGEFQVEALHSTPNHRWHLEPPEVAVEFFQAPIQSFPNPIKDQMEIDYSLQQSFSFPGKIASRIKVEHKHAQMGEAELESLKRRLIRDVKVKYFELYLLDRRLEFIREDLGLLNRFVDIARRQYEVGMGRQADILRAQTELTTLRTDSITLAQSRLAMEGMLNAYLNRKSHRPIRVAKTLTPIRVEWDLEDVLPVLKDQHPDLKAMRASVEMREAEGAMARREYLPDFMVRGEYKDMRMNPAGIHAGAPDDAWALMIGMHIPLAPWSAPKYRAGVAQSRAALNQAKHEFADMENMAIARAQGALLKARSHAELARISRTSLLPQAEQALESNLAAYQGGRGDFMALLEAYRMRLKARENTEMATMQLMSSEAELEEAIGMDLESIKRKISEGNGK